jgi:hypothetical protein
VFGFNGQEQRRNGKVWVRLSDKREFVLNTTLDQWENAFQEARRANAMLEVVLPDGSIAPIRQ